MKPVKKILICLASFTLCGLTIYSEMVYSLPNRMHMFRGEAYSTVVFPGIKISGGELAASAENTVVPAKVGEFTASLSFADIPVKAVRLSVTEARSLYASGELIGLRLYNRGLIVTETTGFYTENGYAQSPAALGGMIPGDVIVKINGIAPLSAADVAPLLKEGENTIELTRDNRRKTLVVTPEKASADNTLKLGALVRDSAAGVGTLTYFDPHDLSYGALGHGISDSDTGTMFDLLKGSIEKSGVLSVTKGARGRPGEICGSFSQNGEICGNATVNCAVGVFGTLEKNAPVSAALMPVGLSAGVTSGDASIISTVDDRPREYSIKILRTTGFGSATKSMLIKVTDARLLERTGGIIQGMSGSPIIQNGKIIGAVTHVFVNDPTRGYGIFIENMLAAAEGSH